MCDNLSFKVYPNLLYLKNNNIIRSRLGTAIVIFSNSVQAVSIIVKMEKEEENI